MKQVTQTLRTGVVQINDVPVPALNDKFVLVRSTVSVISAGTEKTKIDMGKKSLLQKAKARPDLVKQVINKIQTEGLAKTLQTVSSRLNSPSPLGYSSAGAVVAVGGLVEGLMPGDRVACAGAGYANHAEFVAIPRNLVAKIPESVSDEDAAFTTVGAIALQGIRLADPKLGETFLVLGLGLLGQIAVQLLRANGCRVLATDLDNSLVGLAEGFGATGIRSGDDLERVCHELTNGQGVDAVVVCAGTSSNQPIETCGAVTREKGRVVVVGAVRMDIPREDFFKKEISVVISRSYGPGRYDPSYEEGGNDYPLGYVRFTEQRNMETFLGLLAAGTVEVNSLITHRFELAEAAKAYDLIEGKKTEPYIGITLNYASFEASAKTQQSARIKIGTRAVSNTTMKISCIGAGNYATASLLPPLKDNTGVSFAGLLTSSGRSAEGVARQFDFGFCTDKTGELLASDTDAVIIATRHDSHASSVVQCFEAGKHAYVEKPLGLTVEELGLVHQAYQASAGSQLMVGFNRRFAPLTQKVMQHFAGVRSPLMVSIRVNAGEMPADHWIQDPEMGGGRMIGEGCHFVDLASALVGANPVRVSAFATAKSHKSPLLNDNLAITMQFDNGSVASILYTADGAKAMPKEYVEVFGGGRSAVINDFKEAQLYAGDTTCTKHKLSTQDKGQKAMLAAWLDGLKSGVPCIPYETLQLNSLTTILAVESLGLGQALTVDLNLLNSADAAV
ncbi:MAG: putative dehydrogenase/threonine dehydrogenase-like Zn-dependent dehydrogenase [Motiliproteus sp.]|jgi:predicted dehydrogenase/threonine dehydrogenase-like Zn-dependent dehydrogenase